MINSSIIRIVVVVSCLLIPARLSATPILVEGKSTGDLATAIGELTLAGNLLTLTLKNTSPYDGRVTGVGFDLISGDVVGSTGLNGYVGSSPGLFKFSDGKLGNVPEFNGAILDFGWITGKSGNFNAGKSDDGIVPQSNLVFTVTGPFFGLTEEQLASALFVRFQRLGLDGEGSDVGQGQPVVTAAEPLTMLLVGTGTLLAIRRSRRRQN